jgi:hypothetical protein
MYDRNFKLGGKTSSSFEQATFNLTMIPSNFKDDGSSRPP